MAIGNQPGNVPEKRVYPYLVTHFSYHKCMTVFFMRIFQGICDQMNWHFEKFLTHEMDRFIKVANQYKGNQILTIGNVLTDLSTLPNHFVGSHIIRDPRDLLISGYKYHLWCTETWAVEPLTERLKGIIKLNSFPIDIEIDGLSYQKLINSVDMETGLKIELNWRRFSFVHMMDWDYNHPMIMELRYEEIFGNEVPLFEKLFHHYGFDNKLVDIGLQFVERYSFENQKKYGNTGENKHLSTGESGQWKNYFFDELKEIFKERYQKLLENLAYEHDDSW